MNNCTCVQNNLIASTGISRRSHERWNGVTAPALRVQMFTVYNPCIEGNVNGYIYFWHLEAVNNREYKMNC